MIRQGLRLSIPSHSVQFGFQTRSKSSAFHRQDSRICRVLENDQSAVLAIEELSPLVEEYLRELGLNDNEITYSITEGIGYWNHGPIPELTLDSIDSALTYLVHNDVPVRSLRGILLRFPALLYASVDVHLDPVCRSMKALKIEGLSFAKVVSEHPRLLLEGDIESMANVIEILQSLGIHETQVHKMIRNNPKLLMQSSKELKEAIFDLSKLFASGEDLVNFLNSCPTIIHDFRARFEAVWEVFKEAGMSTEEGVHCIRRDPRLLIRDPRPMKGVLYWFLNSELTSQDVKSILLSYPSLLIKSVENLTLKKRFLVKVAKRPFRDVLQYPNYFNFSIDRVIGPRFTFLRSKKEQKLQTTSLLLLVSLSNHAFAARIARVLIEEYLVYQAQWSRMYGQKFDSVTKICKNDGF